MELGRIISVIDGEERVMIRKEWMTKLFVTGDVLSFILQGGGRSLMITIPGKTLADDDLLGGGCQAAGSLEALDNGAKVIIVGLFIQLICFGFFIVVAVAFHRSINAAPTGLSNGSIPWRKHMRALYLGSFLIMVRSVFRAAEYLQGFDGYLVRHEAYLYIFDAVLMLLVMVLFNWIHPAEIAAILSAGWGNGGWKMASLPHHNLERM